uniref:Uncharacterized protein n=1 Tax=Eutreptiella gymnastica TaxID=73025 RepID=A0A7S1HRP8_9EUGL
MDGVIGSMLEDVLMEEPARPLDKMISWLKDFVATRNQMLEIEEQTVNVQVQEYEVLDWSVAGNKSKDSHLTFITQLQDKLAELTDRVVQGKYKDVASQTKVIEAKACKHGYVRIQSICSQIIDTCYTCHQGECGRQAPRDLLQQLPSHVVRLRALLASANYNLTMLQIELESLFDESSD